MAPHHCLPSARVARTAAGVTLVELIVVIVLLGALSLIVIPRLNVDSLQATPVAEQIAAEMRYAQSLAFTRSQPHVIEFHDGSMTLRREEGLELGAGPSRFSDGSDRVLFRGLSVNAPDEVDFSSRFGRPGSTGNIQITVGGGGNVATITVFEETGYVSVD